MKNIPKIFLQYTEDEPVGDWNELDYGTITWADEQIYPTDLEFINKDIVQQYAEFCVRCDRDGLPLIDIDSYVDKLHT